MAQRSSPILPLTRGIGAVSPVNVGGPGSAEEAFRRQQGVLQRLLSGLGGGNNVSLEDLARSQFRDRQDLMTGLESAGSSRSGSGQSIDITGQSNQILPPGFSSTDLTPIPGSIGMSEVPVTGAPDIMPSFITTDDPTGFSILTPRGQASLAEFGRMFAPVETPRERKERAAKGEAFRRSEDAIGGTLFGDAVDVTPAEAQETAGILTDLITGSASRGGAETAATDGKESGTNVQGDVTDITDQPDDLVETDPRFGAETATGSGGQTTEQKKTNLYADLMKQSLDSYKTLLGKAPSEAKTMEEYKKEFSDATGIDITGQPDNSAALTAFGLALMQNKAGKGFDVGELLSETGKAGEKALPLMAQARKEAREAQIAAGQYALGASKEDKAARAKALDEATKYLINRRDTIMTQMADRRNQLDDQASKREHDREMRAIEMGFKNKIEATKAQAAAEKAAREGRKIDSQYFETPEYTNFKIRIGFTDDGSRPVFANAKRDGVNIANAYVKAQRAQEAMGRLDKLLTEIETSGMPSGQILFDRGKDILIALGADPDAFYKDKGVSPEDQANAILNVLIMENKRFATQETGNGISNQDRNDLAESFGKPGQLAANPRAARVKLAELRSIFDAPLRSLEQQLTDFYTLEDMYADAETFAATTARMDEVLAASPYGQIPNEAGDDGIIRFAQGEY